MQQPLRDLKCLTVSRAPLIRGRLPQGVGVGGWINVPDEHFSYVMEHLHVVHAAIGSSGGGVGGGGVTSLMLRNICTLRMLSYDHQGGGVGGVY